MAGVFATLLVVALLGAAAGFALAEAPPPRPRPAPYRFSRCVPAPGGAALCLACRGAVEPGPAPSGVLRLRRFGETCLVLVAGGAPVRRACLRDDYGFELLPGERRGTHGCGPLRLGFEIGGVFYDCSVAYVFEHAPTPAGGEADGRHVRIACNPPYPWPPRGGPETG